MLFAASAIGQTLTAAKPDEFEAQLRKWATTYYPAVIAEPRVPQGLLLGFLVDSRNKVLKHSVAIQRPPPVAVAAELERMFPERSRAELIQNGSMCVLKPRTTEKWYCIVYAQVEK